VENPHFNEFENNIKQIAKKTFKKMPKKQYSISRKNKLIASIVSGAFIGILLTPFFTPSLIVFYLLGAASWNFFVTPYILDRYEQYRRRKENSDVFEKKTTKKKKNEDYIRDMFFNNLEEFKNEQEKIEKNAKRN